MWGDKRKEEQRFSTGLVTVGKAVLDRRCQAIIVTGRLHPQGNKDAKCEHYESGLCSVVAAAGGDPLPR